MTEIRMEVTPTGRTLKGPGFIARMYDSRLRGHMMQSREAQLQCIDQIQGMDFSAVEARILSIFSGNDPRNHFGKFATRRNIK